MGLVYEADGCVAGVVLCCGRRVGDGLTIGIGGDSDVEVPEGVTCW